MSKLDGGGWEGTGECFIGIVPRPGGRAPLPAGLRPFPGPQLVVAARYVTSPVGPYHELAVAQPALFGNRVGMCTTTMAVDLRASRDRGRDGWGFPKELATLHWASAAGGPSLRWEERGIVVRSVAGRGAAPGVLPYSSLQRRIDGPLWVTGRLRGTARFAWVHIEAPEADPLMFLAGRHPGALISNARVRMRAGRPLGTATRTHPWSRRRLSSVRSRRQAFE